MRDERALRSQARQRMLRQYTVAGAGAGLVFQDDRSWLIMEVLATTCDRRDLHARTAASFRHVGGVTALQ